MKRMKNKERENKERRANGAFIELNAATHDEICSCCVFRFVAFIRVHCMECSENHGLFTYFRLKTYSIIHIHKTECMRSSSEEDGHGEGAKVGRRRHGSITNGIICI